MSEWVHNLLVILDRSFCSCSLVVAVAYINPLGVIHVSQRNVSFIYGYSICTVTVIQHIAHVAKVLHRRRIKHICRKQVNRSSRRIELSR
ncbi:hypothetical protein D3C77_448350 [compost metagenome]